MRGYCGPGDWLGEAPVIAEDEIVETRDYDVVVLGGGHAGLMAACGAVDEGATVAVVEMQPWSSYVDEEGTSGANLAGWYGEDIGHVNSQFLIDRGFGPYNTGEITAEFCKRAGGRVNPGLLRNYVQQSGPMFDRYKEIYDSYADERKKNDSAVYMKDTMVVIDGEPVADEGTFDMSNMFEYPLCNTQAAWSGAGVEYPISCGGYKTWPCNAQFYGYQGNNIEYVHKYIVKHTQDNGADWLFETTGIVLTQNENGDVTGLIAQGKDGYIQLNAAKGVVLAAGDFIGDPAMCWALLNEGMEWGERSGATADDWIQTGFRVGAAHKMGCWAGGMIEPSPRGWMGLGGGANTLEELATLLGYEGDAAAEFLKSIEHYNELCKSSNGDTDFGKDAAYMIPIETPPFYGGKGQLSHSSSPMMVTLSGLVTDETQNVLTTDWKPIKGLYAAGNCLGGRYGFGYSTPMAGNSVGMAMTHGWLAGQTAAKL